MSLYHLRLIEGFGQIWKMGSRLRPRTDNIQNFVVALTNISRTVLETRSYSHCVVDFADGPNTFAFRYFHRLERIVGRSELGLPQLFDKADSSQVFRSGPNYSSKLCTRFSKGKFRMRYWNF